MSADPPWTRIRSRLAEGRPVYSTFVKLPLLETLDVLAACGLDAVVVDLEHSQLDEGQARLLVRHAAALRLPALVRIPAVDAGQVNRLLEAGAAGMQLSQTVDRAQVEELAAACRYPPAGRRSLSLAQPAAAYGAEGIASHLRTHGDGPLLVVQIETSTTRQPVSEMVAGVDVAFIGTTDLAVDIGVSGHPDDPLLARQLDAIASEVRAAGPPTVLGGWVPSWRQAEPLESRGARYLTVGSDLALLADALRRHFGDRSRTEEEK